MATRVFGILFTVIAVTTMMVSTQQETEGCICYDLFDPVCGSDGVTYGNACDFNCNNKDGSKKIVFHGKCEERNCFRACPHTPIPVCGSDGKTYGGECALRCSKRFHQSDLKVVKRGKCDDMRNCGTKNDAFEKCRQGCPQNIQGVCGSDGKDYSSDCDVGCNRDFNGKTDLKVVHQGRC